MIKESRRSMFVRNNLFNSEAQNKLKNPLGTENILTVNQNSNQ